MTAGGPRYSCVHQASNFTPCLVGCNDRPAGEFTAALRQAADEYDRDEAYAALTKIARAAGCWERTLHATSIAEVGDIIAAAVTANRGGDHG